MSDLITRDLVRLDADLGAEKHDVIRALARSSRTAAAPTMPTSSPPTRSPARGPQPPVSPAASRSPTAGRRCRPSRPWASPASLRRSSSVPRTARPTSPS